MVGVDTGRAGGFAAAAGPVREVFGGGGGVRVGDIGGGTDVGFGVGGSGEGGGGGGCWAGCVGTGGDRTGAGSGRCGDGKLGKNGGEAVAVFVYENFMVRVADGSWVA